MKVKLNLNHYIFSIILIYKNSSFSKEIFIFLYQNIIYL